MVSAKGKGKQTLLHKPQGKVGRGKEEVDEVTVLIGYRGLQLAMGLRWIMSETGFGFKMRCDGRLPCVENSRISGDDKVLGLRY